MRKGGKDGSAVPVLAPDLGMVSITFKRDPICRLKNFIFAFVMDVIVKLILPPLAKIRGAAPGSYAVPLHTYALRHSRMRPGAAATCWQQLLSCVLRCHTG